MEGCLVYRASSCKTGHGGCPPRTAADHIHGPRRPDLGSARSCCLGMGKPAWGRVPATLANRFCTPRPLLRSTSSCDPASPRSTGCSYSTSSTSLQWPTRFSSRLLSTQQVLPQYSTQHARYSPSCSSLSPPRYPQRAMPCLPTWQLGRTHQHAAWTHLKTTHHYLLGCECPGWHLFSRSHTSAH